MEKEVTSMSPTIRIDDDVFEKLKENAEPFVDTPNTVLRRVLGLPQQAESLDGEPGADGQSPRVRQARRQRASTKRGSSSAARQRRSRAPRAEPGTTLPDAEYELPLLEILRDSGGRAPTREVIDALGARLDGRFTEVDRSKLASGDIRWRNRAQFVRLALIERGDMRAGSPRGVWEISDQGLERVGAR
jgi:hypothetical protein